MPDEPGYTPPRSRSARYCRAATTRPELDSEHERCRGGARVRDGEAGAPELGARTESGDGKAKRCPFSPVSCCRKCSSTPGCTALRRHHDRPDQWVAGQKVVADDDNFFVLAFQGVLCLFLLEMGMTASRKLKDLRAAGPVSSSSDCWRPISLRRWESSSPTATPPHPHGFQAGNLRPVRGALWRGVVHRRPGRPAPGHPRGEPDPAAGGITGFDFLVQCHYRHPAVYRDQPFDLPLVLSSTDRRVGHVVAKAARATLRRSAVPDETPWATGLLSAVLPRRDPTGDGFVSGTSGSCPLRRLSREPAHKPPRPNGWSAGKQGC